MIVRRGRHPRFTSAPNPRATSSTGQSNSAEDVLKSLQGEIVSDFEIQIEKEQKPSREVRGRINKGGPLVRLESFNGDVILRRKK